MGTGEATGGPWPRTRHPGDTVQSGIQPQPRGPGTFSAEELTLEKPRPGREESSAGGQWEADTEGSPALSTSLHLPLALPQPVVWGRGCPIYALDLSWVLPPGSAFCARFKLECQKFP